MAIALGIVTIPMVILTHDLLGIAMCIHVLQGGSTPLHYATYAGHYEAVKILADLGATVDVTNNVS